MNNEGTSRLINAVRKQAGKVSKLQMKNNILGTMTNTGIYVDSIEDEIPNGDFLRLETDYDLKSGDRVLCVPVGDYFIVVGKVV